MWWTLPSFNPFTISSQPSQNLESEVVDLIGGCQDYEPPEGSVSTNGHSDDDEDHTGKPSISQSSTPENNSDAIPAAVSFTTKRQPLESASGSTIKTSKVQGHS